MRPLTARWFSRRGVRRSWRPAGADAFVRAADGLAEAHPRHGIHIGRLLGERVPGVLRDLAPGRAARPAETLDALLMSWNRTAPEVARALDIPPQTARKRLRRLEELFGERLGDPAFRFEALLALRTRAPARPPRATDVRRMRTRGSDPAS